ncbi:pentatricopeptide repeat-containing protein At4g35130, chloroplastic [Primulina huaijiensis]|uniref:pentatricopeptide repeat-containing protein At4g35130, chloroplastic n=1 Tax=Primulina huaijiensis TaxID=1492673 RepID=UPI003CC78805
MVAGLYLKLCTNSIVSQNKNFPAKVQASKNIQNHDPNTTYRKPKPAATLLSRRHVERAEKSPDRGNILSARTLLFYLDEGCLENALQMFETITKSSTFIWTAIIRELTDSGLFQEAIVFYYRMQIDGIKANKYTFPFVIKACAGIFSLKEGGKVHSRIVKLGFAADVYICNALIFMYAKVGCVGDSEKVFEWMPVKDLVSWNSMINGYVLAGEGRNSLKCLQKMQASGVKPDRFSIISALGGCALERNLLNGKEIFCHVFRNGFELDLMIQCSLIDMFGKCGQVDYAERFFGRISNKNVVIRNAMIAAYALNGLSLKSISCLVGMQEDCCDRPDAITMINLLPSCSKMRALRHGKAIHGYAIKNVFLPHLVLETALIDMYGKCGGVTLAEWLFLHMEEKNLISWNAIMAAFMQNGLFRKAVEFLFKLRTEPFFPDQMTFAIILPAYAEAALLREGKQIHGLITKLGFSSNTFICNSLIHMYAKCGDLMSSQNVFDGICCKDVISWNTIIMAYAIHGFGANSIRLFSEMTKEGYNKPNGSTFVSLLTACSIGGNVNEGQKYFDLMKRDYDIDPGIEHYGCVLDLLGRLGNLDLAKRFIDEMPLKPTPRIWGSLLSASRHHRNIEMAELCAEHILSLDNNNTGCYVLLSNMYADVGKWDDAERVRCLMEKEGLEKTIGRSTVEVHAKAYVFTNHDRSQAESNIVYNVLDILLRRIGEDCHVYGPSKFKPPELIKRRAGSPTFHGVRLAICFGLISSSVGKPVLVRKNTRICEDCHRAAKKMSEGTNREIVVGDPKTYHHFKNGHCSCGDYW